MYHSISDEAMLFLYAGIAGAAIFFVYDLIALAAKQKDCSFILINLCDGFVLLCACAIMTFALLYTANGIVRGFEFFGVLFGAILYKTLFSRLICALLRKIMHVFTQIFKLFFKILLTPLQFMYKMIYKCIVVFICPVAVLLKKVGSHVCFRTKHLCRTVRKTQKKL